MPILEPSVHTVCGSGCVQPGRLVLCALTGVHVSVYEQWSIVCVCRFDVYNAVVVLRLLAWFVCCSDLSMNKIVRLTAIAMLPDNTWLKSLGLKQNSITSIAPNAFAYHASRMEELDLSENKLTEITAQAFASCSSLATLLLHENRIMKIYKNAFQDLAGVSNTVPLKLLSTGSNPLLCIDSPRTKPLDRLMSKTVRHLLHVVRPRIFF